MTDLLGTDAADQIATADRAARDKADEIAREEADKIAKDAAAEALSRGL